MFAILRCVYLMLGIATLFNEATSYVLVQVRKDENKSNVDALIHKIVPSYKFDEIADTARKQFKNFKQFKIKSKPGDNDLESIVFAIKTGPNDERRRNVERTDGGNLFSELLDKFLDLFRRSLRDDLPSYRAKLQKYNIKPEIIHFKNNNGKPSMMLEVDTNAILRNIKDFLSSKKLKAYTDKLVNKAAVIYRTFKEELEEA